MTTDLVRQQLRRRGRPESQSSRPDNRPSGFVLLVVLAMLALFGLLAASYVAMAGQSRSASRSIAQVRLRQPDSRLLIKQGQQQLLRGTNDSASAFFGHDLMGDVYGEQPIVGRFRHPSELLNLPQDGVQVLGGAFLKIPLDPMDALRSSVILSPIDDAYNGRVITFLGGPLQGYSFRILHYVGERLPATSTPQEFALRYSILIHLSEFDGSALTAKRLRGEESGTLQEWLAKGSHCFAYDATNDSQPPGAANPYVPYRFLINDAAFNGVGRGLEWDTTNPEHGNLHQPQAAKGSLTVSAGLLHQSPDPALWKTGGTAEGFDVADYRDFFLAYQPLRGSGPGESLLSRDVIPSFHRPELVNHISHLFGTPSSMSRSEVQRLLELLDLACARPLSVRLTRGGNVVYQQNPNFNSGIALPGRRDRVDINLDNWPGTEAVKLQEFVAWLINGPWDVDNDLSGLADSVWVDPNLPLITSPDGKIVKALLAPMVEDLDGRLNINTASDTSHADSGFANLADDPFINGLGSVVSHGFGFGPAEVSIDHLLNWNNYASGNTPMHQRYGRDGVPGVGGTGSARDDVVSRFYQREQWHGHRHFPTATESSSGIPLGRKGNLGFDIDRFGNLRLVPSTLAGVIDSEIEDDPYETRQRTGSAHDELFTLAELENLLRRFDAGGAKLPDRLRRALNQGTGSSSPHALIHRMITTRSMELRYPTLAAPDTAPAGNLLGWIMKLHEERYRRKNQPAQPFLPDVHDPSLTAADLRVLFPMEFGLGLRLNLNRSWGDGRDNDQDGQVDEPQEWMLGQEMEHYPGATSVPGDYLPMGSSATDPMGSRQWFARHLYCLAYVIVPRDYRFPGTAALNEQQSALHRARVLAQWAINVVDFRDSDAAMSRFEYDAFPFGAPGSPPKPSGWTPQPGNVVWGLEFPELALTESLAFHDKRTKDTEHDDGSAQTMADGDPDQDQFRLPEGSLFLELMALRSTGAANDPQLPSVSSSLYTENNGVLKLDLGRLSPQDPIWGTQPVWRIGLSGVHHEGISPNDTLQASSAQPSNLARITYQTCKPGVVNTSGLYYNLSSPNFNFDFDRVLWFAPLHPGGVPQVPNLPNEADPLRQHRVFYNRTVATPMLEGGSYLVLGPRETTYVGGRKTSTPTPVHAPSPQRILIQPNQVSVFRLDGQLEVPYGAARKNAMGMVMAAEPPNASWDALTKVPHLGRFGVGINISEPNPLPGQYYPLPTSNVNATDTGNASGFAYPGYQGMPADGYRNFLSGSSKSLPDRPFDDSSTINPVLHASATPRTATGTYPNVRTAYLQRLADPEMAYHPSSNPYITIDWISIDLTVFNGEDTQPQPADGASMTVAFQSRYKDGADGLHCVGNAGIENAPQGGRRPTVGTTMLSYSTSALVQTPPYSGARPNLPDGNEPHFDVPLGVSTAGLGLSATTLGYLNVGRPVAASYTLPADFDGFGPTYDSTLDAYDGSSLHPLASFVCANRLFASPHELMLVPAYGPGELNRMMTHAVLPSLFAQPPTKPFGPFGQMINFFDSTQLKTNNQTNNGGDPFSTYWMKRSWNPISRTDDPVNQADLQLLLELVETPPAYSDSGIVISPTALQAIPATIRDVMFRRLQPPHNHQSHYVYPGKVNINSIAGEEIWKGIEYQYLRGPHRVGQRGFTLWPKVLESRRGYNVSGQSSVGLPAHAPNQFLQATQQNPNLHADFPTQFVGAFRSASLANIAPGLANPPLGTDGLRSRMPSATGLLRPDLSTSATLPLMLSGTPNQLGPYPHSDRQPWMAMQRLTRLPNLVSFQSNVFAVRWTLGFFEYDPVDGLGSEHIGVRGEPVRHRALFVIDRSIPVGYRTGEDLNTHQTILLERYFE
jgi:hypothetical protein